MNEKEFRACAFEKRLNTLQKVYVNNQPIYKF